MTSFGGTLLKLGKSSQPRMTKITWQAALCYTDCFHPSVLAANVDTSQNWRGQLMLQKKVTDKSFFFGFKVNRSSDTQGQNCSIIAQKS